VQTNSKPGAVDIDSPIIVAVSAFVLGSCGQV